MRKAAAFTLVSTPPVNVPKYRDNPGGAAIAERTEMKSADGAEIILPRNHDVAVLVGGDSRHTHPSQTPESPIDPIGCAQRYDPALVYDATNVFCILGGFGC